jgi:hypothetical protein
MLDPITHVYPSKSYENVPLRDEPSVSAQIAMHTYISEQVDFSPTNILAQWIRADGTLVRLLVVLVFIITHVDGICHKKGWFFIKISIQCKYVQRFT